MTAMMILASVFLGRRRHSGYPNGRPIAGSYPAKARASRRVACRSQPSHRISIARLLDCSGQVPRAPGLPKDLRAAFPLRHSAGALYQAFPACEVRRVLRRLEFHYVPKHASWLNMVEIEIGVLRGQCLDRRIATPEKLVSEIAAWERQRNTTGQPE